MLIIIKNNNSEIEEINKLLRNCRDLNKEDNENINNILFNLIL